MNKERRVIVLSIISLFIAFIMFYEKQLSQIKCRCDVAVDLLLQFPEYSFKVFPVNKCPMNKEAWDKSSDRLKCTKTHGYHCVPNSQLTSLIEFCYPRGEKILFQEGVVET